MTDLTSRILALFPPDSATELTRRAIVKSLALGPMQTHKALKSLVAEGKLVAETEFGNLGILYRLPNTSGILAEGQGCTSRNAHEQARIAVQARIAFALQHAAPSQAILAARRTALIDEAVRRAAKEFGRSYKSLVEMSEWVGTMPGLGRYFPNTAATIRSEFNKLVQERA